MSRMTTFRTTVVRRFPGRPVAGLVATVALVTPVLAGCGGGQTNTQAKEHASIRGVSATVGDIAIRDALITVTGTDGGGTGTLTGQLELVIFNQGQTVDELTSVSPAGAPTFTATLPRPSDVIAAGDAAGASPLEGSSDSTSAATSSPSAVSEPSTRSNSPVSLPTASGVFLNRSPARIAVSGLAASTLVGVSIPVTFTFSLAGPVTLQVPVVSSTLPASSSSTAPGSTASGPAESGSSPAG